MHPVVKPLDLCLHASCEALAIEFQSVPAGRLLETFQHMLRLPFQFFFAVTPCSTPEHHRVWNDVDGHPTLDHADIGGGLMVDAAELHAGDTFGSDLDRVDPLL